MLFTPHLPQPYQAYVERFLGESIKISLSTTGSQRRRSQSIRDRVSKDARRTPPRPSAPQNRHHGGGLRRGGVWLDPGLTPSDSQSYPRQPHHGYIRDWKNRLKLSSSASTLSSSNPHR